MIALINVRIILALIRVLEQVDRVILNLIDKNRVGSNPSSDRGYGLIGKTRTLQVFYSGSIPDNSKFFIARKAQSVERNTEDVQVISSSLISSTLYNGYAEIWQTGSFQAGIVLTLQVQVLLPILYWNGIQVS